MTAKSFAAITALALALALPMVPVAYAGGGEGCTPGHGLCGQPELKEYYARQAQKQHETAAVGKPADSVTGDPAVSDAASLNQGVMAGG